MVDLSSSKRFVSIRIRLAVRVNILIGKNLLCHRSVYRIEAGLTRILIYNNIKYLGKVVIGKTRYLLNIVFYTWMFESSLFRYNRNYKQYTLILKYKEHSLMVKFEASNFTFSVQI